MIHNRHSLGDLREQQFRHKEKKNPLIKLTRLMNQYWAIDKMFATDEEKAWAKDRLRVDIKRIIKGLDNTLQSDIRLSLKDEKMWRYVRESMSI